MTAENASSGALMLFDGVCNFCSGSVAFVLKRTPGRDLRFCAMQTEAGQALLSQLQMPAAEFETLVVLDDDQVRIKSEAVLRLAEYMRAPWPWIATALRPIPRGWRDRAYDCVVTHRYQIWGRKTQCMAPDPSIRDRFVLDVAELRDRK